MGVTKEELYSLCLKADKCSDEVLELGILCGMKFAVMGLLVPPSLWSVLINWFSPNKTKRNYKEICQRYLDECSEQIYFLVKNNTETVDMVFEICQYILPAMVQQERNLDEAAVVFVITGHITQTLHQANEFINYSEYKLLKIS